MDLQIVNYIVSIVFFVIIGFFAIISVLATYIFIRYGRSKSLTTMTSLIFFALFILGSMSAFFTIQGIF